MATIKDVARLAQVSISTVSEILNGKMAGTPETRARVEQAAKRLRYVPNVHARKLLTRRSENIAFYFSRISNFSSHLISNPFYSAVLEGVDIGLDKGKFNLMFETIEEARGGRARPPRPLQEDNVDGMLLAGQFDKAFLEHVRKHKTPAVLIDNNYLDMDSVVTDNVAGARQAVEYLHGLGHRRIGFLCGQLDRPSFQERMEGYRAALASLGLPYDQRLVAYADYPGGDEPSERLLSLARPPTALFAANDAIAIATMRHLIAKGVRIPKDLSLIGFDDIYYAKDLVPALTTIHVHKQEMGRRALERLLQIIESGSRVPEKIVLPTVLVARETCAEPGGR